MAFSCQFCSPARVDLTLSLALPSPAPAQAMTLPQPCLCQFFSPVDLTLALALPSPAPPQGDVVALPPSYLLLGGAGAGRQGAAVAAAADDGQASLENGQTGDNNNPDPWPLMMVNAENYRLVNEVVLAAMPPAPMEAENAGARVGEKRRREPTAEAGSSQSQCRRTNGKGWRCKERTQGVLVFCEEHHRQDRERCATRARRRHAAALAKAKATAAPQAGV